MSAGSPPPRERREYRIGERAPMPDRKLDLRPAFDGLSKPSFKPARGKGK
jgi:hypothetical protein